MSMWLAITIIVVACTVADTVNKRYKSQGGKASQARIDALEQRIEALDTELRERVETLERIVTDERHDLKRQFDYLERAS